MYGLMMPKKADITGQIFGRLLVTAPAENRVTTGGNRQTMWSCKCGCGKEVVVTTSSILKGDTRSCGCLSREVSKSANSTHKMYGSRTYVSWNAMLNRCRNKNSPAYPRYGGMGISVCDRWYLFENFIADMGERPHGTSIDRFPNNSGNYEPGNCRWATDQEQNTNKRTSMKSHVGR